MSVQKQRLRNHAAGDAFDNDCHGIVRVKALEMACLNAVVNHARHWVDGRLHAASGIFTEHQVLAIESGKLLFVGSLHRGLHCRIQHTLDALDDLVDWQIVTRVVQVDGDISVASLTVRNGNQGVVRAKPVEDRRSAKPVVAVELFFKLLLQKLTRQCSRAWARAGIGQPNMYAILNLISLLQRFDLNRIASPRGIVGQKRGPLNHVLERKLQVGRLAHLVVRFQKAAEDTFDLLSRKLGVQLVLQAQ